MNQKIILLGIIVAISSLSILFIINEISPKTHGMFEIKTQDGLTEIVHDLTESMHDSKIFLSSLNIFTLVSSDPDVSLITFDPSNNNGLSSSKGIGVDKEYFTKTLPNGTRTYEEYSLNGTLLKSIKFFDETEKTITIIIKNE